MHFLQFVLPNFLSDFNSLLQFFATALSGGTHLESTRRGAVFRQLPESITAYVSSSSLE